MATCSPLEKQEEDEVFGPRRLMFLTAFFTMKGSTGFGAKFESGRAAPEPKKRKKSTSLTKQTSSQRLTPESRHPTSAGPHPADNRHQPSTQRDVKGHENNGPVFAGRRPPPSLGTASIDSPSGQRRMMPTHITESSAKGNKNMDGTKKAATPEPLSSNNMPVSSPDVSPRPQNIPSPSTQIPTTAARSPGVTPSARTGPSPVTNPPGQRRAKRYSRIGLAAPSSLPGLLGNPKVPVKAEDVLKLLNADEPPRVRKKHDETVLQESEMSLLFQSFIKDWNTKFATVGSISSPQSPAQESEIPNNAARAAEKVLSRRPSIWQARAPSAGSRRSTLLSKRGNATPGSQKSKSGVSAPSQSTKKADGTITITGSLQSPDKKAGATKKERGRYGKPSKESEGTALLAVIVLAILASSAAAYGVHMFLDTKETIAQAFVSDLHNAMYRSCKSSACRDAVKAIQATADPSVMPCHDIYRFACGKWDASSKPSAKLSYFEVLHREFLDLNDARLTAPSLDSTTGKIGNVYSSCVAFYSNRSANLGAMWRAARIDTDLWLDASNHSVLFEMLVESILTNRLDSILSIVYHRNGTIDVKIGSGIDSESLFTIRQFMMKEENLPGNDLYRVYKEQLEALNDAIMRVVKSYLHIHNPPVSVKSDHFDKDPVARLLVGPLSKHAKRAFKQAPALLRYPDDASVLQIVARFQQPMVKVAALYALYVPFAAFINFEREASVLRGHNEVYEVRAMCTNFAHLLFKDAFHGVIATSTETSRALLKINAMWKRLQVVSSRRPEAGGLRLKEDPLPPNATIMLHGDVQAPETMPDGALKGEYGGDFVLNIITYTGHTGVMVHVEPASSWWTDAVHPSLLRPPFFYPDATEPFVNYATLGVKLAAMLFLRSVPTEALTSANVMSCFSTYAQGQMNITFEGMDWTQYAGLAWAVEVALDAALGATRRAESAARLERFMLIRFAHAYCGESEPIRRTLVYAVRASTTFATAFACAKPSFPKC